MNHAAIEQTVTTFLSHLERCMQCKNNPCDLCRVGAMLLDGIGCTMPTAPRIDVDVKFTPGV